jgi:hypothetical protein
MHHDLSTICVTPTLGPIDAPVVECWLGMLTPMYHPFRRIFARGMEVADAYNDADQAKATLPRDRTDQISGPRPQQHVARSGGSFPEPQHPTLERSAHLVRQAESLRPSTRTQAAL